MKLKITIIFSLLLTASAFAQNENEEIIRLSEPVAATDTYEIFGANEGNWEQAETLNTIIQSSDDYSGKTIVLETEVGKVCQKKGCFFIAKDGEHTARVTFKDYSFFVPTDSEGKKVKLVGMFEVKELSEEQAKHFAEDAGQNPDTVEGPVKEYSIIATSVLVPKSK
ncbi:MAG: DUF4920 domain-containing protein [Balneolaceae bacterium]|nr:DUF4920 domain-containing protein [Balneolaceae bacterium]